MLKNGFIAGLLVALSIALTACNNMSNDAKTDSRPNDAMKKVESAFESLDAAKMEEVYEADAWKSDGEGIKKEFKEMKENGQKVEITWTESDVKVDGDTAKVTAKMTITDKDGKAEDESETFDFKKTAAGWKCTG
jgi:ketosteroid isomerase-like protein